MKNDILYPNLCAEITRKGMTYSQFAKEIGISIPGFSKRMRGNGIKFTIDEIYAILDYFNLDFNYLFEKRK